MPGRDTTFDGYIVNIAVTQNGVPQAGVPVTLMSGTTVLGGGSTDGFGRYTQLGVAGSNITLTVGDGDFVVEGIDGTFEATFDTSLPPEE